MAQVPIDEIKVPKRTRTDMGDIDALAESMSRGQLQEIVVDSDMRLIAGARRIKAAKKLGWNKIRTHVAKDLDDAIGKLLAERDENTCRKDFTPGEGVAMGERVLKIERPAAKERERAGASEGGKKSKRGSNKGSASCATVKTQDSTKRTDAKVAKAVGMGTRTYQKAREVEDAAKTDPEFKQFADEMNETGKVDRAYKKLKNKQKDTARKKDAAKAKKTTGGDDHGVKIGDFRNLMANLDDASVDLIFTDPPYSLDTLPLYGDLAREAARVLKPGASLITYLGQYHLPEVLALMTPHIKFLWPLACVHTGRSSRMNFWGIVVKWKPMLWFVNGDNRRDVEVFVDDLVESKQEKGAHEWQQSVVEASYYIEHLTKPGEMVLDPFCGGATTSIAARRLDRRWLTFEVDKDTAHLARKRIKDETNASNG